VGCATLRQTEKREGCHRRRGVEGRFAHRVRREAQFEHAHRVCTAEEPDPRQDGVKPTRTQTHTNETAPSIRGANTPKQQQMPTLRSTVRRCRPPRPALTCSGAHVHQPTRTHHRTPHLWHVPFPWLCILLASASPQSSLHISGGSPHRSTRSTWRIHPAGWGWCEGSWDGEWWGECGAENIAGKKGFRNSRLTLPAKFEMLCGEVGCMGGRTVVQAGAASKTPHAHPAPTAPPASQLKHTPFHKENTQM
jgi:hypothetical protein